MGPLATSASPTLSRELRAVVSLSLPVIITELGWIGMSVVDTIMVAPLGSEAIGAVSIGGILFETLAIFGIGLLLGLDTLVSQAWGAGRPEDCDRSVWHGLYLAAVVSPVLMAAMQIFPPAMKAVKVHPDVLALGVPYLHTLTWSLPPLFVYAALRRYLQGMSLVRPVMIALITANLVNVAGNAALIPHFGVEGAGWATCAARVYMAGFLSAYALKHRPHLIVPPALDIRRIRELLRLGFPAACQILFEISVFAIATVLAGKLRPDALAAHHVVLNIIATTFMIPLGISSAGAVLVGQAIGRRDPASARHSGWLAIGFGAGFMLTMAVLFLAVPGTLLRVFTDNADVLALAVPLLMIAAAFQIFDGVQVVTTGVLRGAGNTRTPMLANLMGHWLLGLPAGYALCFIFGFGVNGLWMGLSLGLIVVGSFLLIAWRGVRL